MRAIHKLSARAVSAAKKKGLYGDGAGLYLQVSGSGSKSWIFRYTRNGRARAMGLGPLHTVSLKEARDAALDARKLLRQGIDPIDAGQLKAAQSITFKECAEAYIEAHKASWRNAKHASQWSNTLKTYAYPSAGGLPVQAVNDDVVRRVLEPIWQTKSETASRVRGRMEAILDWARVRGYRKGENPARWKGHLDKLLPAKSKVRKVKHHKALPYEEIVGFMVDLREQHGIGARALEFAILTAARTSEVIGATWDEIDMEAAMWSIPDDRMKAGKDHRVPLSGATIAILKQMKKARLSDYVFPGLKKGRHLSNMSLLAVLKRMGRSDLTVHGFRSTFRDWAGEATHYPREVAEMALAHAVGTAVEQAYQRGDLFEKRRGLMEDWAGCCYCDAKQDQLSESKL